MGPVSLVVPSVAVNGIRKVSEGKAKRIVYFYTLTRS